MDFVSRAGAFDPAVLDLIIQGFLYGVPLTIFTARIYKYHPKMFKRWEAVRVHMPVALFETARYHVMALYGPVQPDILDLAMALAIGSLALHIVRDVGKGFPLMLRPMHQVIAVLRIAFSILAYALASPDLHRASVKLNSIFAYPRWWIFICSMLKIFPSYNVMYTASLLPGGMMAILDGDLPGGIYIYFAALTAVVALNRWIANAVTARGYKESNIVVRTLVQVGFVDFPALKVALGPAAEEVAEFNMGNDKETKNEEESEPADVSKNAQATKNAGETGKVEETKKVQ